MTNKDVRKSLERKKGNDILIWIWNDSGTHTKEWMMNILCGTILV